MDHAQACPHGRRAVKPELSLVHSSIRVGQRGWSGICSRAPAAAAEGRVRTNIEIEDVYVETIKDRYGVHTKTEAVDLALRHLAGQPMNREEALAMRGARAMEETPSDAGPRGTA